MASQLDKVAEEALSLPGPDRLRLARQLLESMEPVADEAVERAWEDEIARRIATIDSGTAQTRPWEEIKREFKSRFGR